LINEVGTGRHFQAGGPVLQFGFKLMYDLSVEDMLHQIGIAINVRGCNVRIVDKIKLPETVIAGDPGRFAETGLREPHLPWPRLLQVVFGPSGTQETVDLLSRPGPMGPEGIKRDGKITDRLGNIGLLPLQYFICRPQEVLPPDLAPQPGLAP
jgi:hypothetical protein